MHKPLEKQVILDTLAAGYPITHPTRRRELVEALILIAAGVVLGRLIEFAGSLDTLKLK